MSVRNLAARRLSVSSFQPVSGFRDPLSIPGLAAWWDFSSASRLATATNGTGTVSNGSQIAYCADRSGNGRHATQGTANNRPTWNATGVNSLGAASYAGGNNALSTAAAVLTGNSPVTVFWVMTRAVAAAGQMLATTGWGVSDLYWSNAARNVTAWATPTDSSYTLATVDTTTNTAVVGCAVQTALARTQLVSFRNNSLLVSPIGGGPFTMPAAAWSIGRAFIPGQGGSLSSHNGLIGEILVYGAALSVADVANVSRYLGAKWGITVA